VFEKHDHFVGQEISSDCHVWRYMSTTKLLNLVATSSLNFTRADIFEDRWEGKLSNANWDAHEAAYGEHAAKILPFKEDLEKRRSSLFHVSSWSLLEHESTAMWREYGDDSKGVAVRTSWGNLEKSLNTSIPIYGFRVIYNDYADDWLPENNTFHPLLRKRHFFNHEMEARLLISSHIETYGTSPTGEATVAFSPNDESIQIPIDVAGLITEVYFGASMPAWEQALVEQALNQASHTVIFNKSALAELPRI